MADRPDRYSQAEMDKILGRAIERSKEPVGIDHETMVEAAREVGLSKEAVEAAAREVKAERARRSRRVVLGLVVAGCAVVAVAGTLVVRARLARSASLPDGVYVLRSVSNDTCLSGPGWTKAGWASADELLLDKACTTTDTQKWILHPSGDRSYTLESKPGKKCLDVPRARLADGVTLQQYECSALANQKWRVAPGSGDAETIVSVASNKCVTVGGAAGKALEQSACDGSSQQGWLFERVSE